MKIRNIIMFFNILGLVFSTPLQANDEPQEDSKYEIIGKLYISGIYLDLNDRQLNKQKAFASLAAVRFTGPEVAFQKEVPIGTIMTIIGPVSERSWIPFVARRYYVNLNPTVINADLDIIIQLNRELDGELDGLNHTFFKKVN